MEQKFSELFKSGLGTLKDATAKLHIKPNSTPGFMKAQPVLLTLRKMVEAELDHMVTTVIKPVTFSESFQC